MHQRYMQLALGEAVKGVYFTKPNPSVGCVIVKNNHIIAAGYHQGYGQDHAEIDALKKIQFQAQDCDLYVTLEPCAHYGKTPPCVDAIIKAGVKRVITPFNDPNPLTQGASVEKLRQHGIEVINFVESEKCYDVNRFFMHFMRYQRPYVIAKWAMTGDGNLPLSPNPSPASGRGEHVNTPLPLAGEGQGRGQLNWISNPQSRAHTHLLRQRADAILIGANTLRSDNPQLTTRVPFIAEHQLKHPLRIILTTKGEFNLQQQLLNDEHTNNTLIACTSLPNQKLIAHCQTKSIKLLLLAGNTPLAKIHYLLNYLSQKNIMSLIVEGGQTVLNQFFQHDLVDEIQCYIAQTDADTTLLNQFTNIDDYIIREKIAIDNDTFIRANKEYCYV